MLRWARRRNNVLPFAVAVTGLATSLLLLRHSLLSSLLSMVLASFLLYLEVMTQWSFRSPLRRKPPVNDTKWERIEITCNGLSVVHYVHRGKSDAPVAWVIHGWTAGAIRMMHRSSSFIERGWTVIMVDLPSHGDSDGLVKWSAEETTTVLISCMNQLKARHPQWFDNSVCYFGHSMGSFVGLRISHRRDELTIGTQIKGWIFESPMTGYTEIHHETCNILRIPPFLRPWILAKTIRHFNAINGPKRKITSLSDADIPSWGMTKEPTLLVQAEPDERLGAVHHERLIKCMSEHPYEGLLHVHLLKDLRHSGSHESASRKIVIDGWLDEQFSHSS